MQKHLRVLVTSKPRSSKPVKRRWVQPGTAGKIRRGDVGSGWPSGEASASPSPLKSKRRLFGGEGARLGAGRHRGRPQGEERDAPSPREGCGSRRHTECPA